MNIVCIICSELLAPSDDVFIIPCGHLFHFTCLSQWLERSQTCPQCRKKTNSTKIHRIYFNFSNNETIVDDASTLQDKIDKLKFQILLKDKDIKYYMEKSKAMEAQNVALVSEIKKVESQIREKETAIHALKDQIKYFKQQCSEVDAIKQEIAKLKQKVEDLRHIQLLIDASPDEAENIVSKTNDPSILITYVSIMKREMTRCISKRKEVRAKLQSVQQELTKVSMERNYLLEEREKRKKLEEEMMICESEKLLLQNKLREIINNGDGKTQTSDVAEAKQIIPSSSKISKEESTVAAHTTVKKDIKISKKRTGHFFIEDVEVISQSASVQSQGILALKEQYNVRRGTGATFSILTKKPKLSENAADSLKSGAITYDGLGGHSKYDKFPSPVLTAKLKKTKEPLLKPRKLKLNAGDNTN